MMILLCLSKKVKNWMSWWEGRLFWNIKNDIFVKRMAWENCSQRMMLWWIFFHISNMIPPGEKIIETKKCRLSGQEFFVTDKDLEFYDKVSPIFAGKKYSIPSPTLCPDERLRRRMMYRNEITLYKRICDLTSKTIISLYSPKYTWPVYDIKSWWWDTWNPLDYGRDFDFSKTFFEQFQNLSESVPHPAAVNDNGLASENCEYTNDCWYAKDCYLVSCAWRMRECYYCHKTLADLENCIDCEWPLTESQHCYECIVGSKLSHCFFLTNCHNCSNCSFGINLIGCRNCYGCSNLVNKEYHFFNQSLLKEAYLDAMNHISFLEWKNKFEALLPDIFYKENCNINCENCAGEYLFQCKNCYECFEAYKALDCKYYQTADTVTNCHDVLISGLCQWNYENLTCDEGGMTRFSIYSSKCRDTLYSELCHSSENLFGCVALRRHQKNAVFNKLYSQQEYEILCGKMIDHMQSTGEWGEFFPHNRTPYAYNETIAQEYFPITADIATRQGWGWHVDQMESFGWLTTVPLPIEQYSEKIVGYETAQKNIDSLLSSVIACSTSKKRFKILPKELAFYIEHNLPIPTRHPDERSRDRISKKNGRNLIQRACTECSKTVITAYPNNRRVLCEECYRKIVY